MWNRNVRLGFSSCSRWVVPPGLECLLPVLPALKRWAKLDRPFGAALEFVPLLPVCQFRSHPRSPANLFFLLRLPCATQTLETV
jgi:hypothetical protein